MNIWLIFAIFVLIAYVYFTYFNLKPGDPCSIDEQCSNGACGRATAADDEITTCCSSGETTAYAGYDYCTNMPSRATCWSNAMCATGYCSENNGGLNKGYCSGDFKVGDSCNWNADCANAACGRPTAALEDDEKKFCCPSGKEEYATINMKSYCTGMPDGAVCIEDTQCTGGTCRGNSTGFARGLCTGSKKAGEACDWDSDCSGKACGRVYQPDGNPKLVCCADGQTQHVWGGKSWCTGQPVGARCSYDDNCANGACGRETAADGAVTTCCSSGEITTYGGYDYCKNMSPGSVCWSDAMCASNYCRGNASGFQKGVCD
jgi:hypothetical protein